MDNKASLFLKLKTHTQTHAHTHTQTRTHTDTCAHTQTHTGTQTHTHTHGHVTEECGMMTWHKCNALIHSTSLIEILHSLIFLKADFFISFEVKQAVLGKGLFPLGWLATNGIVSKAPLATEERSAPLSE